MNFIAENYILLMAILGGGTLSFLAGTVGAYSYLRKQALVGDVISHAALPGVAAAFLFSGVKDSLFFLIGATISGLLAVWIMDFAAARSKLKPDVLQAVTLSVFFGLGVVLLTYIQHSGMGGQSGLENFLFGNAAAISTRDFELLLVVFAINISLLLIFHRGFKLLSFDELFAINIGFPVKRLKFLLSLITVSTVAVGVQMVGVILMAALLITPASGARFLTTDIKKINLYSGLIGAIAGVLGVWLSSLFNGLPSGPTVVVVLTIIIIVTIFFGKEKGIYARMKLKKENQLKIDKENVLKFLHKQSNEGQKKVSEIELQHLTSSSYHRLDTILKKLDKLHFINRLNKNVYLTEAGIIAAREIVRKHRLWEMYLSTYFELKEDHLHDDAEGIEHVITPEIERHLTELLDRPSKDPHQSEIPY